MSKKILLVDDDPNILQGYRRQLRKRFDIEIAPGGKEALEEMVKHGPFAVIVSDMRMPQMDGVQFLTKVRQIAPDSVRMMLTGNSDQKTAMEAVNEGNIFRFLTKPCSPDSFAKALEAGLTQYRLITLEREILSKTLSGSVGLLTEVLTLVNPAAFGRTAGVRGLVHQICQEMQMENCWEIEVAAMLSQVGCVVVPETTLAKLSSGETLSLDESQTYQNHPDVGSKLIAKIPRLQGVAKIVAYQKKRFDDKDVPRNGKRKEQIPFGARVLKLALDVDRLLSDGKPSRDVLDVIRDRKGWYDPSLVSSLAGILDIRYITKSVGIDALVDTMVLEEHVVTLTGEVLLAAGQEVTPSMRARLMAFAGTVRGVREPIRVRCPIGNPEKKHSDSQKPDMVPIAESVVK